MKLRRTFASLLAALVATMLIVAPAPSPANADDPPLPLINVGSNKCFEPTEPTGHVEWAGDPVKQSTCRGAALQNWRFESVGYVTYNGGEPPWWCFWCITIGNTGYHIVNQQTGQCLDARDGATADWSVVQQWTCKDNNARSMIWFIGDGDFPDAKTLFNVNSELCLDVAWGSSDDGAQIQQFHCTSDNTAQNFRQ